MRECAGYGPETWVKIVPSASTLTVSNISLAEQPAFVWRSLGPGGALWGPFDKWQKERELGVSAAHQRLQALWERRNRFNTPIVYGGHAMGEILPPAKYAAPHPEYYALVKGKRPSDPKTFDGKHGRQPCTTNPDVIRITVEYCRRMFREHPEYEAVSISANDGRGFCECDNCRRLDTGAVMNDKEDPEMGRGGVVPVISDRMITFANQVGEQVAKTNPGKKVLTFAYGQYRRPPERVKANDSVIVAYTMRASTFWDKKAEELATSESAAWNRFAVNSGVYEYFTQTNFPDMPRLFPELLQRSVRRLHEQGSRFYQPQSGDGYAINGLNQYLLARLLWDPSAEASAIQRDYVEKGFGKAAPAVSRYFRRLADHWRSLADSSLVMNNARLEEYRNVARAYPVSLRNACRADLEEAYRLAEGRDRDRVRFLQQGFRYFKMTTDATEKTLPLAEAGWNLSRKFQPPANPDMAAFRAALAAWETRDRYIESLRDDFVLSYLWIRSNDGTRTFNPLERMRDYARNRATAGK